MAPRTGKKPKPAPPPSGDNPNIHPEHNSGVLTQEDKDDLFLIHLAQARQDNAALEKAMEAVRAVRKVRTRNRNLCRTDGFPLALMDEILKDEELAYHEVQERETIRLRMRGVANQPGGSLDQLDLFNDSFAASEAAEARWRGDGKLAGLRAADNSVEEMDRRGVPPEWRQAWMEEWGEGQQRLARAFATKNRIEGKPDPAAPEPAAEGEQTQGPDEASDAAAEEQPA